VALVLVGLERELLLIGITLGSSNVDEG